MLFISYLPKKILSESSDISSNNSTHYKIVIVPPEPVFSKIIEFKTLMYEKYKYGTTQSASAELTLLLPFNWDEKNEYLIIDCLKKFAQQNFSVEIELSGFENSGNKIALRILDKNSVQKLQINLRNHLDMYLRLKYNEQEPSEYNPYIETGLDDRNKSAMKRAWAELKTMHFNAAFIANNFSLVKQTNTNEDKIIGHFELE